MTAGRCPSPELLHAYTTGRLALPAHEALDAHLDACPGCQQGVAALDAQSNTPLPPLRQSAPDIPFLDDPTFRQLVAHAKSLADGPAAGAVLGNYVLQEPLGAGGMGRVFKATHRTMKRIVAVKLLAPELLRSDAARARFQREVEAVARLSSPHIVAAHDAGEHDGQAFLVMEYVEGRTLAEVVKQEGPLPVARALGYVLQAARGLAHAHAAGLVHRDVKPANLLRDARGTVKVLDLGLARLQLPAADAGLTSSTVVMGTAAYMAPEQAADTHRADGRADVYSLGCTLYFLLTGRPPYEGRTTMEVLFAHREQPVPSLRSARPDCPLAVDALFRRMTAKRPEDRPPTMTAVVAALEQLPASGARRRRPWWTAAAGVLLAAAGLLAWALLPPAAGPPPSSSSESGGTLVAEAAAEPPPPERQPLPPATSRAIPPTQPEAVPAVPPMTPVVEMMPIRDGEFLMGSPDDDPAPRPEEKPRHRVKITRPFYLGKFEVTQAQYQEVTGTNPSTFSPTGRDRKAVAGIDTRQHPVESVSWLDAVRFCNRLSERHGLLPYYRLDGDPVSVRGGSGFRLPTEAEWEYACRAGGSGRWDFGNDAAALGEHAWFADNAGGATHPVGRKRANAWGLYDMHGNVPEWCWDRYDADYYKRTPESNPPGPGEGSKRVFRGGAWNDAAPQTRAAVRNPLGTSYSVLTVVGFRVARDAEP